MNPEINQTQVDSDSLMIPADGPEISEVHSFFDRKGGLVGEAITRAMGGPLTIQLLSAIDPAHRKVDNCALVKDLTSPNPDPRSVQAFTVANYQTYLGIAEKIVQSDLWKENPPPNLARLRDYVSECLNRLERDLKVDVRASESGKAVKGLSSEEVAAIQPLPNLPEIRSRCDAQAYEFVLVGSNMGARAQSARQLKHFGLSAEPNGGAEFLNLYKSMFGAASAMGRVFRETKNFTTDPAEVEQLKRTASSFMKRLAETFEGVSSRAAWLQGG